MIGLKIGLGSTATAYLNENTSSIKKKITVPKLICGALADNWVKRLTRNGSLTSCVEINKDKKSAIDNYATFLHLKPESK